MENINNTINVEATKEQKFSNNIIAAVAIIIALVLLLLGYFYIQNKSILSIRGATVTNADIKNKKEREKRNYDAYYSSLRQNNPMELQNSFLDDIKNGVNDEYTKSSIYFITHRFFDNGGDIYEIYDFVNEHPEINFLKEAEMIYPEIFGEIKKRNKNLTYRSHLYAYCAYLDVILKHNYGDIASIGTVANQYAKLVFFSKMILKSNKVSEGEKKIREEWVIRNAEKSLNYIALMEADIKGILNMQIDEKNIPARDILVGMNQFASSLRYLEAAGVRASTTVSSKEVFAFSSEFSHRNVKELEHFTAFLNASTLAIVSSSSPEEIKVALYPILDFDTRKVVDGNTSYNLGILGKIIDTKLEVLPRELSEGYYDIYSKWNIILLAKKVPEFKKWLMYNGWTETDFK